MIPQPTLPTARLLLQALNQQDQTAIHALHSDPEVQRYITREPPTDLEATAAFIQRIQEGVQAQRWYYWGLHLTPHPRQLIGTICLWQFTEGNTIAEIGFDLLPAHQGLGYMSEALQAVLHFAEGDLKLKTIRGLVHADNAACIRLLNKNRFMFVRELTPEEKFSSEQDLPIVLFERLRE
ncbi:MAG: GNAT family N-acetyltransferase [Bacteroidota bacterium]